MQLPGCHTIKMHAAKLGLKAVMLLIGYNAWAQKDTSYIVQFERPYNLQFNTWLNTFDFYINPPRFSNSQEALRLTPNMSLQSGLSLGLKYVTIAFGVQVPGTHSNVKTFGRTNYYDFSFSWYQKLLGFDIYSRSFSGIYRTLGADTNVSIRPDATIDAHGLNWFFNFNHKRFSYRSSLSMAEFQKKSSGALLLMINMGYRGIRGDSSLIPPGMDKKENYGELTGMKAVGIVHINVRPGYAYNICMKGGRWFVAPSAFAGLGVASYQLKSTRGQKDGWVPELDGHVKLSVGNNGSKYFWNVFGVYDVSGNQFGWPNFVIFQSVSFGFNAGYRFQRLIPSIKWL